MNHKGTKTQRNRLVFGIVFILSFIFIAQAIALSETERRAKGADWVSRFAFIAPQAAAEGVCAPSSVGPPAFSVTPAATGKQLVRVSLPFAPGVFPAELHLMVSDGREMIAPDVRPLTYHPGQPVSVRRAIVTYPYDFTEMQDQVFFLALTQDTSRTRPTTESIGNHSWRIGDLELQITEYGITIRSGDDIAWQAKFIAPKRRWSIEPTVEIIENGEHYLWLRLLVPDVHWPRIIEVRADSLGTVAIRGHLQRLEPTPNVISRAPDLGWRVSGLLAGKEIDHALTDGQPISVIAGDYRVDFPDAHLLQRGRVSAISDVPEITYLRCRAAEQVPMQYAMWRTATVVIGPKASVPWTALLEPGHRVQIPAEAFDAIYGTGQMTDLSTWPLLEAVNRYHIDSMTTSTRLGDDFGNVTGMPTSGAYSLNRLNHCPPIFEQYYRCGDARLRDVALHWCENFHDLSIWWGTNTERRFGGTRYPDYTRLDESMPRDPNFMWRSNSSFHFCTKGYDTYFFAYEETGDPRMATALRWQVDYAKHEVHTNQGECRSVGDVTDFVRLYMFTGDRSYLEHGLRLFRELRTKLSTGDLFDQGGMPLADELPFIDDDKDGFQVGYAKPYIIGYALLGLPGLAELCPDEQKLRDVIRAVANFMACSQDPVGGWRYPHPRSSWMILGQAMEHAVQLARAAAYLERRGEKIDPLLDAIERTLQQRILAWERSGLFLGGLGGWEKAAGMLKDGKRLTEIYSHPEDRDRSRDYTEGSISLGGSSPEGVVHFFEVLDFYLDHRPPERLFHANATLQTVLDRIEQRNTTYVASAPGKEYLRYGLEAKLPTFRDNLIERLMFPLAYDPDSGSEFYQWRISARQTLLDCLLIPPPRADFQPAVIAREDRGSYEARKLVFNVSSDCRIPAYLLVPKGKGPFPAVIALHDHGAEFFIGKEKVIKPFADRQEVLDYADDWVSKYYGNRYIGDELAKRGYVVFSIDALFWGDRGRKEGVKYEEQQVLSSNLLQMGMTWIGVITWDDIRSAEFVASLPEVDPDHIGAVGLSMGSHRTWMLSAATDRVAAGVAVCWMGTTAELMTPGQNQAKGHSAYAMLVPDLRNYLDYPDTAAIACPKPMLFYNGTEDKLFSVDMVSNAYEAMHRYWDSQDAGDKLVTKLWPVPHLFSVEMQQEAFDWLDQQLKN